MALFHEWLVDLMQNRGRRYRRQCLAIVLVYLRLVPGTVTTDKSGANNAALEQINTQREIPIKTRQVKYPNNIVEQDHRAVRRVTRPMLGFKSFRFAHAVLAGIDLIHTIRKGQFMIEGCDGMSFAGQFYALEG